MADFRITTNGDGTRTLHMSTTLPAPDQCVKSDSGRSYQVISAQDSVSLPPEYGMRPLRVNVNGYVVIPDPERTEAPAVLNEYVLKAKEFVLRARRSA